jgi:hypothetical protein
LYHITAETAVFLWAVMSSQNKLSLAKIIQKIPRANINRIPSLIGVYQRLNVLKNSDLVNESWQEKEKFSEISQKGMSVITKF